jgi:hypothetical protein
MHELKKVAIGSLILAISVVILVKLFKIMSGEYAVYEDRLTITARRAAARLVASLKFEVE